MKSKLLLALSLALAAPIAFNGCKSPPSERVVAVQSLRAVGASAEAAVSLSAVLYRDRKITALQAQAVMDAYNLRFQPAYRLAVSAAYANLDTIAPEEVATIAGQLTNLVLSFR